MSTVPRPLPSRGPLGSRPHSDSGPLALTASSAGHPAGGMNSFKKLRKPSLGMGTLSAAEKKAIADCALKLREIGDKLDLQQKVLYVLRKLFRPGS